jgi:ubiquinone/menaquinone biosynthesis C-methylase UbiE
MISRSHRFFDKFSEGYREKATADVLYREMKPIVLPREGKKVLDIGNGGVDVFLSSRADFYVGLDLSLEMLRKAKGGNIHLVCGDALSLPFKKQVFNTVLYSSILHHLTGRKVKDTILRVKAALREAHRCLDEEGNALIIESCLPLFFETMERLSFQFLKIFSFLTGQPEALLFSEETLGKIMKDCGYGEVKCYEVNPEEKKPWEWITLFMSLPFLKVPKIFVPAKWIVLEGQKHDEKG